LTDYTTQIAAIDTALASGELTVESDGDRVTYRSTADLLKARDHFARLQSQSLSGRPSSTVAQFDPR
jgi:hypothetical protein